MKFLFGFIAVVLTIVGVCEIMCSCGENKRDNQRLTDLIIGSTCLGLLIVFVKMIGTL